MAVTLTPAVQFTSGNLSRLADMSLPEGERLAAQAAASAVLEDRIIIADYSRARQPYMFFGFIPGSSILLPWPHQRSRCPASFPPAVVVPHQPALPCHTCLHATHWYQVTLYSGASCSDSHCLAAVLELRCLVLL